MYQDETFLNAHHTLERCWTDNDGKGGLKVPSAKGGRLIILHAGWKEGCISNADLVFRGKKGTGDYHKEMNTAHFLKWFKERLIPNLPATSVIVLDNAKYHNSVVEKIPTKSSTKKDMIQYLDSHEIPYDKKLLKAEMFMLTETRNPASQYLTDVFANRHSHGVLRLLVGHCELNPVELTWAKVKGYAASHNKDFTMARTEQLAREGIAQVTAEKWANCVKNVIQKVERHYRETDGIVEEAVDRVLIEVRREEEETSESEEGFFLEQMTPEVIRMPQLTWR